jgi:hypothetical protein
MRSVWLQALIILYAYVGFKATDDFALCANEVLDLGDVDSAAAGYLADRLGAVNLTAASFALLLTGSLLLATGIISPGLGVIFLGAVITASLGIFALRGLYFAIMREGRIPVAVTGSAVGWTPFAGWLHAGRIDGAADGLSAG